MAFSINTIRNTILDSIKGRKIGLDPAGYLVGQLETKAAVEDIQSTTPTTLLAYGLTRILTSGSSQGPTQHFLPVPVTGVEKTIAMVSTSTGSQQFLSTANGASIIMATAGTTVGVINFVGPGGFIRLFAASTTQWIVTAIGGSTAAGQPLFTTST